MAAMTNTPPFLPLKSECSRWSGLQAGGETINVGDGDGEGRVTLAPQRRGYRLTEVDADTRGPVGPERQALIGERHPRARRRPPVVVAGDVSLADVGERCLKP